MSRSPQPPIDVCLVLEGTYPYVLGGVASWVHQLIAGLPEVRFGLIALVADESVARTDKYAVPANVVYRQDVPLFGALPKQPWYRRKEPPAPLMAALDGLHDPKASRCPFFRTFEGLAREGRHTAASLLASRAAWEMVVRLYHARQRTVSLLDYFWTWRAVHTPLLRLLDVALPYAPIYHTTSTGYAGLLAALAKLRHGSRVAITEHGLFNREREMEIFQADWIYKQPPDRQNEAHERFFKGWWRAKFDALCELTYGHADRLVTLHETNRRIQVEAGAPAERLTVVPNGIYPDHYRDLRAPRDWSKRPFRVGFIGRVVPIKDVKTFLRALHLAGKEVPIEGFVLGPTDEDPAYMAACRDLAESLDLGDRVQFMGRVDVKAWLPRLDLNVLTSLSESQPLVILEAAAAGVPSIATDVGACREMLHGGAPADVALGESGLVTPPITPEATARAIVALATDPARHARMAEVGLTRVERYYRQDDVFAFYRGLYADLTAASGDGVAAHNTPQRRAG
jgi:glycosyltransferase involved in cell wall biosynthesis